MFDSISCVIWWVGLVVVLRFVVWDILRTLYKRVLRAPADLTRFKSGNDTWAVVTGASDGIGKAYSIELAKRGFNILAVSRTASKLEAVQKEIKAMKGVPQNVKVETLSFDFSSPVTESSYKPFESAIKDKAVGILVNNVGVNYPYCENYLEATREMNAQILTVNTAALNEVTRIVLPGMVSRKKGGIINLSSLSGVVPAPMLSTYSGTKAYTNFFSHCLAAEYKRSGIAVQSVTPGMVVSEMSKIRKPSLIGGVTMPAVIAKGSLNTLGLENHWSPFWVHALIEYVLQSLPLPLVLDQINKMHIGINKRAKAKIAREAAAKTKSQ